MADFYSDVARKQFELLEAQRAASLADLAAHRANGDTESAAQTVQNLANLEAERQNLTALVNQYAASQQPPPPESQEMKAAKPISQMTHADVYEMTKRDSRYGVDDDAFRRGIEEVRARRARGE